MDRGERRYQTMLIQKRRLSLYANTFVHERLWWTNPEEFYSRVCFGSLELYLFFLNRVKAKKIRVIGQMKDKLSYKLLRERDRYVGGLEKKMKVSDDDLSNWLDDAGLPNNSRPRRKIRHFGF